jgi:hypothetical protein
VIEGQRYASYLYIRYLNRAMDPKAVTWVDGIFRCVPTEGRLLVHTHADDIHILTPFHDIHPTHTLLRQQLKQTVCGSGPRALRLALGPQDETGPEAQHHGRCHRQGKGGTLALGPQHGR